MISLSAMSGTGHMRLSRRLRVRPVSVGLALPTLVIAIGARDARPALKIDRPSNGTVFGQTRSINLIAYGPVLAFGFGFYAASLPKPPTSEQAWRLARACRSAFDAVEEPRLFLERLVQPLLDAAQAIRP
jgi:hypothetical protein